MKPVAILGVCIVFSTSAVAQTKTDIDHLVIEADAYRNEEDFLSAEKTARRGFELSQKINYPKGTAEIAMQLGRALKGQEKFEEAILVFEKAVIIRRDVLKDATATAKTYNTMASTALDMGEPQRALIFANNAVDFCSKDSLEVLAKILNNRANIFEEIGKIEEAINSNRQSIGYFKLTNDTLTRLQSSYGLAKRLIADDKMTEAQQEILAALPLSKSPDFKIDNAQLTELLGHTFLSQDAASVDSAIFYFQKALEVYKKLPQPSTEYTNILFNLGEAHGQKKDFNKALDFYNETLKSLGESENITFENSIKTIRSQILTQIDLEKTQSREILYRNLLILALIIITIISSALYWNARHLWKKEKELREKDQENIKLLQQAYQLKHDIVKNGLMAIDNQIKSQMPDMEAADAGQIVLQKVENMIARLLTKVGYPQEGTSQPVTLKPFVRELHLQAEEIYRGAQNYSFLEGVDDYPISPKLREELEAIVTEAFTNIHKHAQCTTASLSIEVNENGLTMTIQDNGIGFDSANIKQSGLRNIDLRTREINGRCKITSTPGQGTTIRINIPGFPEV